MTDQEHPQPDPQKQPTPAPQADQTEPESPPEPELPEIVAKILDACPGAQRYEANSDRPTVQVKADDLLAVADKLRNDPQFAFDMLCDHTAVDRIESGVFELIYQLYSTTHRKYFMLSCSVPRDNPIAPTLSSLWKIAEWLEREVYDLTGVLYDNHPDLRRVFLEDDWKGFPLRKDYKDDFMLTLEIEDGS